LDVVGVAPHQAARFADGPVDPLQARALHPRGRPLRRAGEEVERAADADAHRCAHGHAVARDPAFLLGVAEGDADHVGAHRAQRIDHCVVHGAVERHHRRRDDDDVDAG
jgi:hypothetical protein